jgi:predicted pyridoxine 5'-phosphate oxidase superfamily flavin-nucleotide-binding protein
MAALPGSTGEHTLQDRYGTAARACAFYDNQVLDHLNLAMREFLARQEMAFIATADGHGEADCSFRAGPPGFVRVLGARTLAYPEYRGNGVMASLGNLSENPHIGLLFVDFFHSTVGLHVNGRARIVENADLLGWEGVPEIILQDIAVTGGRRPERWVVVTVEEAYIHCSKHIPLLQKLDKAIAWGTDDVQLKGGDYFQAKASPRPWRAREARAGAGR